MLLTEDLSFVENQSFLPKDITKIQSPLDQLNQVIGNLHFLKPPTGTITYVQVRDRLHLQHIALTSSSEMWKLTWFILSSPLNASTMVLSTLTCGILSKCQARKRIRNQMAIEITIDQIPTIGPSIGCLLGDFHQVCDDASKPHCLCGSPILGQQECQGNEFDLDQDRCSTLKVSKCFKIYA